MNGGAPVKTPDQWAVGQQATFFTADFSSMSFASLRTTHLFSRVCLMIKKTRSTSRIFPPEGHKETLINQLLHQAVVVETFRLSLFCLRSHFDAFI